MSDHFLLSCTFVLCLKFLAGGLPYINQIWIDSWAQFTQYSTYSFYMRGAQKHKKESQVIISIFTLLGFMSVKAERKYVG
jgi:hypothetical protein